MNITWDRYSCPDLNRFFQSYSIILIVQKVLSSYLWQRKKNLRQNVKISNLSLVGKDEGTLKQLEIKNKHSKDVVPAREGKSKRLARRKTGKDSNKHHILYKQW